MFKTVTRASFLILGVFITLCLVIFLAVFPTQPQLAPAPLSSLKSHHVALSVPNFEETIQWYQEKLGFKVTLRRKLSQLSTQQAFLELNGFSIEIFARQNSVRTQLPPPTVPDDLLVQGYKHIALVVDDLDAAAAEFKRRKIEFLWEPRVDKDLRLKLCFIKDNNGNLIEIVQKLN
jgi:methylmalonyl-CoA/ethylmalonyl-CoA epimerase